MRSNASAELWELAAPILVKQAHNGCAELLWLLSSLTKEGK